MKKYKGIFFDWDGTAVLSRRASVEKIAGLMKTLLGQGVKLAVISGTTMENIGEGRLHTWFTPEERQNLFLGLGRGAFNYAFDQAGEPYVFDGRVPSGEELLRIHDTAYALHRKLLEEYGLHTDIVFSRPNYCKIDLMVENNRGEALFLQEGEKERLLETLAAHGFRGGLRGLVELAAETGQKNGLSVITTTDAKYLEVGITSKSDNVDALLGLFNGKYGITAGECSFWGDEYIGFGDGLYGSDSYMLTPAAMDGDFYDVSDTLGERPKKVVRLGGGVGRFEKFLREQGEMDAAVHG